MRRKQTYRINIMHVLEPAIIIVAILAVWTDMAVSAVRVPTVATLWTASLTSALLKYQLLARTQAFAMVIVTVLSRFTLAVQMIIVANFLVAYALKEAGGCCRIGTWQRRVNAFLIGVEDNELAV